MFMVNRMKYIMPDSAFSGQKNVKTGLKRILGLLVLLVVAYSHPTFADKGTNKVQLLRAKNLIKAGDFGAAWKMLASFQKSDTSTAELYFLGGSCLFQLREYADAVPQFERSVRLKPEEDIRKYYLLARVYHAEGFPQKAIPMYEKFINFNPRDKEELEEAKEYLSQSRRAIEWMGKPLNVSLSNMGDSINSEFPEYNPSLTADGSTMIFTSRRPETTGKKQDPDDGLFMEDIFISYRNQVTGIWSDAIPVEGQLNTESHDANLSLSPDGSQIFVYRNMGSKGSGEIFVSKKNKNGKWAAARKVEGDVNSSYFESSACITPDGKTLYFVSERDKKGFGLGDIYLSKRVSKTEWGEPENLGPEINDAYDQIGVFMHPDGKTIYFSSDNPKGMGGYDIYRASFDNGKWSKPENLGYPINTTGDERFFHLSTDGRTAWISSNRAGGKGGIDIWQIDLSKLAENSGSKELLPAEAQSLSILSGQVIDSKASPVPDAEIQITDESSGKLYSIETNETGNYFITLTGNRNYQVKVSHAGFKVNTFSIFVIAKEQGTFTNEKMIVLEQAP
jgi:tetratricopeptide (TPR) repeat protein